MAELLYSELKAQRDINYISRNFDNLKDSLVSYLQQQFPDTWQDFTDVSSGMAVLEAVCYAGDILNFYIDKQFNELFLTTAFEEKNVLALAKNLGYRPRGKSAAVNNAVVLQYTYPTSGSLTGLEFIVRKGTQFSNQDGSNFYEMLDDIDSSTTTAKVTSVDVTNNVTSAWIQGIRVVAGKTKNFSVKLGTPTPFLKVPLPDKDILEIESVSSSDGSIWYQVDYLAQENTFVGLTNTQSTSGVVPYVLTLKRVPKRFTLEYDAGGIVSLRFGSGVLSVQDSEYIPNPEDIVLPPSLRGAVSGFTPQYVDPSDFLNTGTLGATPQNVTLYIRYRTGGGLLSNASSRTINQITQRFIDYKVTGNAFQKSQLESSMEVYNVTPASGGEDEETLDQIRENASAFFATQNRCVTLQDYVVRSYYMPPQFGSVFRAVASKDPFDKLGVKLNILTRNTDGTLATPTNALKLNLAQYLNQFRSLSENLNITNANIVNMTITFGIITDSVTNQNEILVNCMKRLIDYFDIRYWNIGEHISISKAQFELMQVRGVIAVPQFSFNNIYGVVGGRTYSDTQYNMAFNTKNYIIFSQPDSIFEVKFPEFDIRGSVLT